MRGCASPGPHAHRQGSRVPRRGGPPQNTPNSKLQATPHTVNTMFQKEELAARTGTNTGTQKEERAGALKQKQDTYNRAARNRAKGHRGAALDLRGGIRCTYRARGAFISVDGGTGRGVSSDRGDVEGSSSLPAHSPGRAILGVLRVLETRDEHLFGAGHL